jgi:signal transduction histidine kinase
MKVQFTVDSRLLRELGSRLVGRPHIALAELIKNSYDADATEVLIVIRQDLMVISDNGHGMTLDELRDRWMRIGSAQKAEDRVSRDLHRSLTGSKGVGRLAVQLLGNHLTLESASKQDPGQMIRASVDWEDAVSAGMLTRASADVDQFPGKPELPLDSPYGTRIVIAGLQQSWTTRALRDLAREIWSLQPPFAASTLADKAQVFHVSLDTGLKTQEDEFDKQLRAMLRLWTARLVGELLPADDLSQGPAVTVQRPPPDRMAGDDALGEKVLSESDEAADLLEAAPADAPGIPRTVRLALTFDDGSREIVNYTLKDCALDRLHFEIRVFNLKYRQASGIQVSEARAYLRRFGGVHVYDAGFHLPYYGPDTDWLHVEMDHSHRLSTSRLLPKQLLEGSNAVNPLQYLPTNSRLYGVVDVDTSHEIRASTRLSPAAAREALAIQVTRDRLTDNQGYRSLVQLTRFAVDLYAVREAQRAWTRKAAALNRDRNRPFNPPSGRGGTSGGGSRGPRPGSAHADEDARELSASDRANLVEELFEETSNLLPEATADLLKSQIRDVADVARREREASDARVGVLATLATAGIAALANEHEAAKQNLTMAGIANRLRNGRLEPSAAADEIDRWLERARAIRRMFSHMLDEQTRKSRGRFLAKPLVEDATNQIRPLTHGVIFDTSPIPPAMRLARGGYVEWIALLQNVFLNAVNATLDSSVRRVDVDGHDVGRIAWLRIQDTGSGVDLKTADTLFLPFERRQQISQERAALGLGGTGLGLTIVRMLAAEFGATVDFEVPDPTHSTALVIRWRNQ